MAAKCRFICNIDKKLKRDFEYVCWTLDQTMTLVIIEFIKRYIKESGVEMPKPKIKRR